MGFHKPFQHKAVFLTGGRCTVRQGEEVPVELAIPFLLWTLADLSKSILAKHLEPAQYNWMSRQGRKCWVKS